MANGIGQNELDAKAMGGTELLGMRLEKYADPEILKQSQIIRSRFRGFDDSKKVHMFWEHDLPADTESANVFGDEELMNKFDAFVFVSYWQLNEFRATYPLVQKYIHKCCVIFNGIEPFEGVDRSSYIPEVINMIYTPTPHRGLEILVPVFEQISAQFPGKFHLDVYSSFNLYGWEERDEPYRELYARIDQHPYMTNHGTVSNDEIRKALTKADILAYPSIWQETSCLCLIEAMSAKVLPVTVDLAAIGETSGHLAPMVPAMHPKYNPPAQFADQYKQLLLSVALNMLESNEQQRINFNGTMNISKIYADYKYHVLNMASKWNQVLSTLMRNKEAQ